MRPWIAVLGASIGLSAIAAQATPTTAWWQSLGDPFLEELVQKAVAESPSLAQAQARLAEAQASVQTAKASTQPRVSADASLKRATGQGAQAPLQTSLGGQITGQWELDLWGKQSAQNQAALMRAQAREADLAATRLQVEAQTASALVQWRACEIKVRARMDDTSSREHSLRLAQLREQAGIAAGLDTARVATAVQDSRNQLAQLQTQCQQHMHALAIATALSADTLRTRFNLEAAAGGLSRIAEPPQAPQALPAQLLAAHPKVRSTELGWLAAQQDAAAAEKATKPSINLAALLGNTWLRALGQGSSFLNWSLGPSVSVNLWDGGQAKAQIAAAQARQSQAQAQVESAVNSLAEDVQNALAAQQTAALRTQVLSDQLRWQRETAAVQEMSFTVGRATALDVEEARRGIYGSVLQHADAARDRLLAWVTLVRATGTHEWPQTAPLQ